MDELLLHGLTQEMEAYVARISHAIQLLKTSKGVDAERDIILFRLPIAQGCDGGKNYKEPPCGLGGKGPNQ